MTTKHDSFYTAANQYLNQLTACYTPSILDEIKNLTEQLHEAWINRRQVFICGNGGSAANALHMANDFHYGIGACGPGPKIPGLRVEALPANIGILTCLANDTGYENVYSHQLKVKAIPGDLLIVLSGSNSQCCQCTRTARTRHAMPLLLSAEVVAKS